MDVENLLLRAGLLTGLGRRAQRVAAALAELERSGSGRSCLDAGAPAQLTIDAPGAAAFRAGIRVGDSLDRSVLGTLVPPTTASRVADIVARVPPTAHPGVGTWLFWSPNTVSIYVDLRDPDPAEALVRARAILCSGDASDDRLDIHLDRHIALRPVARPWALRIGEDELGRRRAQLLWLVDRRIPVRAIAETVASGRWDAVGDVFAGLVRHPERSGRFVITLPLDDVTPPGLRIGSSGWSLVPELDGKRRALASTVDRCGGDRSTAEALWSLCRAEVSDRWRVGRACEATATDRGVRARFFLVPQTRSSGVSAGQPIAAGTRISSSVVSTTLDTTAPASSPYRTTR